MVLATATERSFVVKSPIHGGALTPRFIVIHNTASVLKDDGDISWLTSPAEGLGECRRESPGQGHPSLCRLTLWRGTRGSLKGLKFMNSYAISIENPASFRRSRTAFTRTILHHRHELVCY